MSNPLEDNDKEMEMVEAYWDYLEGIGATYEDWEPVKLLSFEEFCEGAK